MKIRPIRFGAPMVRAILEGRKSITRRVVKPQPPHSCRYEINGAGTHALCFGPGGECVPPTGRSVDHRLPCPYGVPGERLWVREPYYARESDGIMLYAADQAFKLHPSSLGSRVMRGRVVPCGGELLSPAQLAAAGWVKRNSMFMPRSASRITLEVVSVRVERVQAMDEGDAIAEGFMFLGVGDDWKRRDAFIPSWDAMHAKLGHGWDANPWVWRIEFRRVTT